MRGTHCSEFPLFDPLTSLEQYIHIVLLDVPGSVEFGDFVAKDLNLSKFAESICSEFFKIM